MNKKIISFNQVDKIYRDNTHVIKNLSFEIDRGELVFIAGASGAGKSTILKLIAGIENASCGEIIVNDISLTNTHHNHRAFIRQHIGFIFQDHKILPDRNVFDNVRLPLDILGYSGEMISTRVLSSLKQVGLEHKIHHMPEQLSGGESQRLCIARAIIHKPQILLADEPTANLDRDNALKILELFKKFHSAGTTILVSAHDESLLNDYGKRILRIQHGGFKG